MKQRKLVIGLLVMLAVAVSGFTFAYWSSGVSVTGPAIESGTITIGEGDAVTTTVVVTGEAEDVDLEPTQSQELVYLVNWSGSGADGAIGTLAVSDLAYSVAPGTLTHAQLDAMFDFVVTSGDGAITAGTPQNVTITITFTNEPATKAIYDEIAAGTLSVQFTFTVTAA